MSVTVTMVDYLRMLLASLCTVYEKKVPTLNFVFVSISYIIFICNLLRHNDEKNCIFGRKRHLQLITECCVTKCYFHFTSFSIPQYSITCTSYHIILDYFISYQYDTSYITSY